MTPNQGLGPALLAVAVVLLTTGMIGLLAFSVIVQRRRDLRTRDHLGGRLLRAQDEERARLARDIHDDVLQQLIAATQLLHESPPDVVRATAALEHIITGLRQLARHLHPAAVEELPLPLLLQSLAASFPPGSVTVTCTPPDSPASVPRGAKLALFRVAQEAITNAMTHAGTGEVAVTLTQEDGELILLIRDSGHGFDINVRPQGITLGITSMRERLALIGGHLAILSAPGKGTAVRARIPAPPL